MVFLDFTRCAQVKQRHANPYSSSWEDQSKLKATGFACNTAVYSVHCVANQPVRIDTGTMTVYVPTDLLVQETVIKPYARQEDHNLLKIVTPVKILHGNTTPPVCQYNHEIPAVIFSSSGFVGNVFHEIIEIIIPLYITTKNFQSRVLFILEDYKYIKAISRLSSYEVMNPAADKSVHCFPGTVIGLEFHGHLSLNSSDVHKGHKMHDLRQFLR
ncbi:Glycosyltransferase family 61 protein [Forsythia ovata]|uniref:Glycosyltransferase family 61 protein n=1 Tax=Forsythia ovata TaxID=205694 RepID=A0ABD1VKX7_9LAMI